MSFIEMIKGLFGKKTADSKKDEVILMDTEENDFQHGKKDRIHICVITDCHGSLQHRYPDLFESISHPIPDILLLLGDNYVADLDYFMSVLSVHENDLKNTHILGITGNHDRKDLLDDYPMITKMDGIMKILLIGDDKIPISVGGFSGGIKYKNDDTDCLRTHKESVDILSNMPACDLLVTHDKPCFTEPSKDEYDSLCMNAHAGLYGIGKYIKECKPYYIIHGHLHNRYTKRIILPGKKCEDTFTDEPILRCCYMLEQFDITI